MNNSRKGLWALIVIIVLIIVAVIAVYVFTSSQPSTPQQSGATQNVQVAYACDGGKAINAVYMNATTSTTTGNSVQLSLSDGRQMTLPQTISADGARYSNGNPQLAQGKPGSETFIFWSKGNGAFVDENGTNTYNNCTAQNS